MYKKKLFYVSLVIFSAMVIFVLSPLNAVNAKRSSISKNDLQPEAVFTNPAAITIPAGPGNGSVYPSPIVVSGISGTIPATPGSVKVTINGFSHTFSDDVGMVLVGPTGAALLLEDGAGDDPDMVNVTYTFSDAGATTLPDLTAWTTGTYKPTTYYTGDSFPAPGPLLAYGNPGPAGGGTATFTSVFGGTNPNGTWNLYVRDFVAGDSGGISGGWTLEIASATPAQHVIDMNGDGKTDFSVVRNTGGGPTGQITWFTAINGPGGGLQAPAWGIATDFFIPADYDGDGKTDVAVFRPAATGTFYILQSQTNTVRQEDFGQTGDDPTVVGDYNGDGKADLAVYRAGATAGAQSTWFYRSTAGGAVNYVPWGQTGDFPAPGDYDGDGKYDFTVQRNAGGGAAGFWTRLATGATPAVVIFGTPTDVIVPGDYDGDGKTDIATVRGSGGSILWFVRRSSDSAITGFTWGSSATDFPAQGDYDGDGKVEPAIWRPSATPGQSAFWALPASGTPVGVAWGLNGDYPVANFNAH